jgi:hypothetical protein
MARTRYLCHLDADGWPLERIDTHPAGEHVSVFNGGPEELAQPAGGRPLSSALASLQPAASIR